MKLPIYNQKTIELQNWDKFVQETYGRPYALQQQDGCHDRGLVHFTVPLTDADYYDEEESFDYLNDTVPEVVNHKDMGVSFNAWLARDPKQPLENQTYEYQLELWWARNFYPHLQMIADDLYNKGLLEAGEYAINIDW